MSNGGNTVRRFFKNPSLIVKITGIDKSIIESVGTPEYSIPLL